MKSNWRNVKCELRSKVQWSYLNSKSITINWWRKVGGGGELTMTWLHRKQEKVHRGKVLEPIISISVSFPASVGALCHHYSCSDSFPQITLNTFTESYPFANFAQFKMTAHAKMITLLKHSTLVFFFLKKYILRNYRYIKNSFVCQKVNYGNNKGSCETGGVFWRGSVVYH